MKRSLSNNVKRQAGSAVIEFALVIVIFAMIALGTLELARVEYLLNTLGEVTRRAAAAAANADYTDPAAMEKVQAEAIFRHASGPLVHGAPVTADNVKIDYLSVSKGTWELNHMSALPGCPAGNRSNCLTDPHAANCIRFVRARICDTMDGSGNCERLRYEVLFPFIDVSGGKLPTAETIVPVGSLGAAIGAMPCT